MGDKPEITGRVWAFGDSVDTDQILPGYAMSAPREKLGQYAMAGSHIPDFAQKVQAGDIIVAGRNFGAGSSREQAPLALKDAGVGMVIAASFARIFRRNAINIGLPVLVAEAVDKVAAGQTLTVNIRTGRITLADGRVIPGQIPGESVLAILEAGGLIAKIRRELAVNGRKG